MSFNLCFFYSVCYCAVLYFSPILLVYILPNCLFFFADGRTDPGLSDIDQAFELMGVNVPELEDYINNLEPVGFSQTVPQFPISKSSMLQFPAAGFETDARNALRGERRDSIPEYFPPLVSLQEGRRLHSQKKNIFMKIISLII